jgi:tetratricopeptide (TPR) repeat protein
LDFWDYLVAAGLGLLVFFTPFATGGVDVAATNVAEGICFCLALLWLGKTFLGGRVGFPSLARREFRAIALAAGAFLTFLLFQLVPLPPPILKVLSPHSYDLYRNSLPGWPDSLVYSDPSYAHPRLPANGAAMVTVLPTVQEVRSGRAIPFAAVKGAAPSTSDAAPIAASAWRSLSVAPVLTRAALLKCAAYAALFLVVIFYPAGAGDARAERHFRRIVLVIVLAAGAAVAISGLTQQAFSYSRSLWSDFAAGAPGARASGPFANPDHFANYLAMLLPLAAAGALFRIPLDPIQERLSGFQVLCAAIALLIAAAIVISLSRAGWIEIGLGVVVFAWILRSRLHDPREAAADDAAAADQRKAVRGMIGWFLPLGLGLMAIAVVPLILVGPAAREQAGARVDESVSGGVGFWDRIDMWIDSAGIVRDYPVFGSGSDSWPTVFPRYQRPPWTMFFSGEAQNDYVEVAAECGIVGLALLGSLCWVVWRFLKEGAPWVPSRHWPLFAALLPAAAIMGFHETLDFCMQIPANAILFVILIAMALRLVRTHGSLPLRKEPGRALSFAVPAAIGIAAMAGLVGIACQRETVYPNDLRYPASIHGNEASIVAHPASPIPHLWMADRIHNAAGVWLGRELQAAIWLDPTNPAGRDRYVQALLAQGRKDEALREISASVYLAPNLGDHGYLNARIIPWLSRDERAAAEQGLRQAEAAGLAGAVGSLANLYLAEGRPLKAAAVYEKGARREPESARKLEYSLAAAAAYAQGGKRADAEKLLLASINLAPEDPRPYSYLIAAVYGPEHNSAAAMRTVQTAQSNGADPAPLYRALQEAAQTAGDRELAEAALRQAISSDPSFVNWLRLGRFYLDNQNYERAGDSIRRALRLKPDSGEAYYYLAQAEEGEYQYPAADADYQRAIALTPDNAGFKSGREQLLRKIAQESAQRH